MIEITKAGALFSPLQESRWRMVIHRHSLDIVVACIRERFARTRQPVTIADIEADLPTGNVPSTRVVTVTPLALRSIKADLSDGKRPLIRVGDVVAVNVAGECVAIDPVLPPPVDRALVLDPPSPVMRGSFFPVHADTEAEALPHDLPPSPLPETEPSHPARKVVAQRSAPRKTRRKPAVRLALPPAADALKAARLAEARLRADLTKRKVKSHTVIGVDEWQAMVIGNILRDLKACGIAHTIHRINPKRRILLMELA